MPSPPPPYNFAVIPIVASRHPLWEDRLQESEPFQPGRRLRCSMRAAKPWAPRRLKAEPRSDPENAGRFLRAVFPGIICRSDFRVVLLHWWLFAGAMALRAGISLIAWMWPRENLEATRERRRLWLKPLPVGGAGKKSTGWWGVWTSDSHRRIAVRLPVASYFYLYFQTQQHGRRREAEIADVGINTVILLSSSVFVWAAERA